MKIILTGGGTGGHIYPALAIGDAIKELVPDVEILYLGSKEGIEKDIVPEYGYEMKIVPVGFLDYCKNPIKKAYMYGEASIKVLNGIKKSKKILKEFHPDLVIGTGGFVTYPVLQAAKQMKIPFYIHEQNAFPGRVNRNMSKDAKKVFLGFEMAREQFTRKDNLEYTGNPIRKAFKNTNKLMARHNLGIPMDKRVVFSFGGSQGSDFINAVALEYLRELENKENELLVCGAGIIGYNRLLKKMEEENIEYDSEKANIYKYISDMENFIAAADLVISRAGALSLAELVAAKVPAIVIPMKMSKDNHQYYNAKSLSDIGAAFLIEEDDLDFDEIGKIIHNILDDEKALEDMKFAMKNQEIDSANMIAKSIIDDIKS